MNVTLVKQSISYTRTREPSSLVALAMNGMVKKKKCHLVLNLKKKKLLLLNLKDVTLSKKKYYIEATQVTLKFIS